MAHTRGILTSFTTIAARVSDASRRWTSVRCPARFPICVALLLALATWIPLPALEEADEPGAKPATTGDTNPAGSEHSDLAKEMQNPFANLITFPLQNITSLDVGPDDGRQNVLNLQPVVPLHLNDRWNLMMRPILPIASTTVPDSESGLGDLNLEPFLSPRKGGSVVYGVGVILGFPTASGDYLGTGKWTAGPAFAVFGLQGHWTFSLIVNQQWSYAGDSGRDPVSLLQVQPTVSYILKRGWFVTCGPLISADWTQPGGQQWTVPAGAGAGRVFSAGGQKMSLQLEAYAVPIRPDDGPESMILATVTFLFRR
jgi:hypothetical protein